MALETGTYISDLVSTNPASSDNISQGDDHIRLLKSTIKATFPNITGAVTPTQADLNKLTSSGSPQFSTIELGAASDTTISRVSAGLIAVEGGNVPLENRANTFTANQIISVTDNTNAALRIAQLGTGDAIRVEDSTNPDSTPFIVDASGNVGIGTASPNAKLQVAGVIRAEASGGEGGQVELLNTANNSVHTIFDVGAGDVARILTIPSSSLILGTASTERMRITSGGYLYVGSSSQIGTDGTLQVRGISGSSFAAAFDNGSASAGPAAFNRSDDGSIMRFYRAWSGGGVGNISVTSTATSYNTSSDYRLKESIQPVNDPIARLMALKPINFAWKIDGSRVDGFIAHEAAEVVPEAVTGAKDAVDDEGNPVYQSIDQSKLVPLLTAALQEALTKIDALEARIAALEAA